MWYIKWLFQSAFLVEKLLKLLRWNFTAFNSRLSLNCGIFCSVFNERETSWYIMGFNYDRVPFLLTQINLLKMWSYNAYNPLSSLIIYAMCICLIEVKKTPFKLIQAKPHKLFLHLFYSTHLWPGTFYMVFRARSRFYSSIYKAMEKLHHFHKRSKEAHVPKAPVHTHLTYGEPSHRSPPTQTLIKTSRWCCRCSNCILNQPPDPCCGFNLHSPGCVPGSSSGWGARGGGCVPCGCSSTSLCYRNKGTPEPAGGSWAPLPCSPQPLVLFCTDCAVPSFILTVWFQLPFPGSEKGWGGREGGRMKEGDTLTAPFSQ